MADDFIVTSTNQSQRIGANGRLEDTVTITFELTDDRGSGEVVVPLTADWPTAAEAAVREQVAGMLAILGL